CVIELLYFVVYGHRLYLHSFPTRRSSDLGEQPVDRGNRPARVLEMRTHGRCTRRPGGGGGVGGACAVPGGIRVESCRICVGSGGIRVESGSVRNVSTRIVLVSGTAIVSGSARAVSAGVTLSGTRPPPSGYPLMLVMPRTPSRYSPGAMGDVGIAKNSRAGSGTAGVAGTASVPGSSAGASGSAASVSCTAASVSCTAACAESTSVRVSVRAVSGGDMRSANVAGSGVVSDTV